MQPIHFFSSPIAFSFFFSVALFLAEIEKGEVGHRELKRCAMLWRDKGERQVETWANSLCNPACLQRNGNKACLHYLERDNK